VKAIAGFVEDVVTYIQWRYIHNADIIAERGYISNAGINTLAARQK
jgi:hypothetical protein